MERLQAFIDLFEKNSILVEYDCEENVQVENISYNSREITENTLFFCKGAHFKEQFLHDAISRGAVAYVSEKKYDVDAKVIGRVEESKDGNAKVLLTSEHGYFEYSK